MSSDVDPDVAAVLSLVKGKLGPASAWAEWPGGWPGDIGAALIDAVFSARARYLTSRGKGIQPLVVAWRTEREARGASWTLRSLQAEMSEAGVEAWAIRFGNQQHSPSRSPGAPHGATKAAAVLEATEVLIDTGIQSADDIPDAEAEVKKAMRSVDGIGYATTNYFFMLLGLPGVKPDRMVHRFLKEATGRTHSNRAAEDLVNRAAAVLEIPAHKLDHAIWKFESHASSRAAAR